MKKIAYFILILTLSLTSVNAGEKNDCSELKKFSKDFFACKSANIKSGISNKFNKSNNPLKSIIDYQKKVWSKEK